MEPAVPGIWHKVPGYDGNSDSSADEEEADIKATAEERLAQVLEFLGDRWVDTNFLEFHPAEKPKNSNAYRPGERAYSSVAQRVWGPNGPLPGFRIEHTDAVLLRETFLANGLVAAQDKDWIVQWSSPGMRDWAYQGLHEYQKVNHFPGSSELTRKDRMWRHLLEKATTFGRETFNFVPETFVLPEQLEQFLQCYENSEHLWIVKPHASSRGRGIFLLRDAAELPLDELSVVSRYVDNPLLIQGLKWDLRVYVLVTSFEPLKAYVYREGLTRFAVSPYSNDDEHLQDAYRHLTNYSINKNAANFEENKDLKADNVGHKWSLSALLKHLKCVGVDVELMWARINDLILKTLLAVEPTIASKTSETASHPNNCFEVYGFDVLVDEDLKPWLIEVNLSPSMQAESPLDWQVKSALLADAFNIVGISHLDQQTLTQSRLRARCAQARAPEFSPPVARRSSSTTALRPLSAANNVSSAKALLAARSAEAAEPPRGVVLDTLTEAQLKMLASSLSEVGRRHNFIRLFPTKTTVNRYAPMLDPRMAALSSRLNVRLPSSPAGPPNKLSASQLLAQLLFGPTPVRSAPAAPAPPLVRSRSSTMSAKRDRGPLRGYFPGASNRYEANGQDTEAASGSTADPEDIVCPPPPPAKAVRALCPKSGQRLLFMEYLLRVSSACDGLNHNDKAKICQGPSYARLSAFHRHLQQRQRARKQEVEDPEPGSESEPELELHQGGLIDDLLELCSTSLETLAKDAWEAEATLQDSAAPPRGHGQRYEGGGSLTMEDLLPPAFVTSILGQKVINGLSSLSAAELEHVLAGSQCAPEFRLNLSSVADRDEEEFRPRSGSGREGSRQITRRPLSGLRRGRQDRLRQPQTQAGPLHDLLRVPRDTLDTADLRHVSDGAAQHLPPSGFVPKAREAMQLSASRRPSSGYGGESRRHSSTGGRESGGFSRISRPMSALHNSVGKSAGRVRPPSSKARLFHGDSPMNPAERANGVHARSAIGHAIRSDAPAKFPVTRSSPALREMNEGLIPLRHRPSSCLKMKTAAPPPPAPTAMPMQVSDARHNVHVPDFNFNMEIEF